MTKISKNFTLEEMTGGQSIVNRLDIIGNIDYLVKEGLQKIRDRWGVIKVTSGYRSLKHNKEIGGVPNSQHVKGEAADIIPLGADIAIVFDWIINNLEYDQVILETKLGAEWIHISMKKEDNRKQALIANYNEKEKKMNYIEV
jgi:hypothetical protein